MHLGKIIVCPSDANKSQKKRLKEEIAPYLKGVADISKCQIVFGSDFITGNKDTAAHISIEKLYNRLSKIDDPYAVLVVKPSISKKTIFAAGELMHSSSSDSKDLCIGCVAFISKTGIEYKTS